MVKKVLGQTYIWFVLLLMYLPIFVLIAFSFTEATNVGEWTGFSFGLYSNLFNFEYSKDIWIAVGNTLLIALISAGVSTVLGTLGAIGAFYSSKKFRSSIDSITQIPIVNAEIVMALSLTVMFVFVGTFISWIMENVFHVESNISLFSFWTLLIGHVVLTIPFVYTSVKPKLQQMDPHLYEAALDLGATPNQALWKVIFPECIPGILSGFLLAVTLSLDDFIITAFTRGTGLLSGDKQIETLSTYVQAIIKKDAVPPELRSLTTLIFIGVVIAVILVSIYKNKTASKVKIRKGRI
jgi:spermidine/putrescine transport system permease protein